jgi:hypothetical protein
VRLATLGPDGPTGGFLHDDGPVAKVLDHLNINDVSDEDVDNALDEA